MIIWPLAQLEKDFAIDQQIGKGQYGQVFLARWKTKEDSAVAIKLLKCKRASEKLQMRDEIAILKQLDHENVIKILGAYEDYDQFAQVLEFLR